MSNEQLFITAILGVIAQPIIALLKDVTWSTATKTAVAAVVSIVLGVVAVFLGGGFTFSAVGATSKDILSASTLVFTLANLVYNFLLKGSGLNTTLESANILGTGTARPEAAAREAAFEPAPGASVIDAVTPNAIETPTPPVLPSIPEQKAARKKAQSGKAS